MTGRLLLTNCKYYTVGNTIKLSGTILKGSNIYSKDNENKGRC